MNNYANKAEARNRTRRVTLSGTAAAAAMAERPSNGSIGQILKLLNNCDPLIRDGALKSLIRFIGWCQLSWAHLKRDFKSLSEANVEQGMQEESSA